MKWREKMREARDDLPLTLEAPGVTVRTAQWGGMTASFNTLAKGTDFTPILKGLKDDMCQCPHWGYVLTGALHLRYTDGQEEVAKAGELWYAPAGHTGWVEEDTEIIEFSPQDQMEEVLGHIKKQMGS
jgi:hypothetical protein